MFRRYISQASIVSDSPYLIIEALEDNFSIQYSGTGLNYRVDYGEWKPLEPSISTEKINTGQTLSIYGIRTDNNNIFTITQKCNLKGRLDAIKYSNNSDYYIADYRCCAYLFKDCIGIVNISDNFLTHSYYGNRCYQEMFKNCTSLINVPIMNGTFRGTSSDVSHFQGMFEGCTSLTKITNIKIAHKSGGSGCKQACARMFYGCSSLEDASKIDIKGIGTWFFQDMFGECTSLKTPPALKASLTSVAVFEGMFCGCTSLEYVPELPYTSSVPWGACNRMFKNCISLKESPALPASTSSNYNENGIFIGDGYVGAYREMFKGCTSLKKAGEISLRNLHSGACSMMFEGCTSLETTPKMYVYYGNSSACSRMFYGCSSLKDASPFGIGGTSNYLYQSLFEDCYNLEIAPIIPSTRIPGICYVKMFKGCSKINYIKAMFTDMNQAALENWLDGVSEQGTFVMSSSATWNPENYRGSSGIPIGWTVEYEDL